MGQSRIITLQIDKTLLKIIDGEVLKLKYKNGRNIKNRSQFINESLKYYLKMQLGIQYLLRCKE